MYLAVGCYLDHCLAADVICCSVDYSAPESSFSIFPCLEDRKNYPIIIRFILPFVLILFIVIMLYILIPKTRVSFFAAFRGAMFTTIFLEIAKHIFTWYVRSVVELGKIYGPLTAFISFLLWVFYSSSIFLIGAEIVHHSGITRKE